MIISAPIVGMHFRPPAKAIVSALPSGSPLLLEREPENPYDRYAVKVLVDLSDKDEDFWNEIAGACQAGGVELEELQSEPRHIAYVDSKKTGAAKEVSEAMEEHGTSPEAVLTFDRNGIPSVEITWS